MARYQIYVLDEQRQPVPATTEQWEAWPDDVVWEAWSRVGLYQAGDVRVSTMFVGVDHKLSGPPLLFETMVFGGPLDGEQERYSTWAEAEAGHVAMVRRVRA